MPPMATNRDAVFKRFQTAVVRVEVTGRDIEDRVVSPRVGTGVIVGRDGVIVTAAHVVGKDKDWAETSPGSGLRKRTVKVIGLDEHHKLEQPYGEAWVRLMPGNDDLALLYVAARDLSTAPLTDELPPDNTTLVALRWGAGKALEPVSVDLVPTDPTQHGDRLTVRMPVANGDSGSGLFDEKLVLSGIIVNRVDNERALAVPVARVKSAIAPYLAAPASPPLSNNIAISDAGLVKRELEWFTNCRTNGWYELLELRKELDQFGDLRQCHRIRRIHGPEHGRITTLPYELRSAPTFGTCALDEIRDDENENWSPGIPPPKATLAGALPFNPAATATRMHSGFIMKSRVVNSFAVTTDEAHWRGYSPADEPVEHTTIGAKYPARWLRLAMFFPAGYEPQSMHVFAGCPTDASLPVDQWPKDDEETTRVTPALFFDPQRGCAVLTVDRYVPKHHYVLSWKLPVPPDPPWDAMYQAREQLRLLLGVGAREREQLEAALATVRNEICETFFAWRHGRKPTVHLSLLAFDEAAAATRIVLTTWDDGARNDRLPRGAGVVGNVMRRRRPVYVDTRDKRMAGIYRQIAGMPHERHILCVPLPLPTHSEDRDKLLLNPVMPCLVARLSCVDDSGNMGRLKEPANVESGKLQATISSKLSERLLDLFSRPPLLLQQRLIPAGDDDAGPEAG